MARIDGTVAGLRQDLQSSNRIQDERNAILRQFLG
jgi:hypothetical protein